MNVVALNRAYINKHYNNTVSIRHLSDLEIIFLFFLRKLFHEGTYTRRVSLINAALSL